MKGFSLICLSIFISMFYLFNIALNESGDKTDNLLQVRNNAALEVLFKTEKKYKSFTYFKSKGIATYPENTVRQDPKNLSTAFEFTYECPSKMVISWKESDNEITKTFVVEEEDIYLKKENKITTKYDKIQTGMVSISLNEHSSFFDVPNILILKDISPQKSFVSKLSNVQKLPDENVDENLCYKIQGEMKGVATEGKVVFTYWIDKESFLIKRIDRLLMVGKDGLVTSNRTEKYIEIETK
jgi:hypothetical protein